MTNKADRAMEVLRQLVEADDECAAALVGKQQHGAYTWACDRRNSAWSAASSLVEQEARKPDSVDLTSAPARAATAPSPVLTDEEISDITDQYDTGRAQADCDCARAVEHAVLSKGAARNTPDDEWVKEAERLLDELLSAHREYVDCGGNVGPSSAPFIDAYRAARAALISHLKGKP